MSGAVRPVLPLPGPLEQDPTTQVASLAAATNRMLDGVQDRTGQLARTMLASAVVDLQRGAWDEQILTWLAAKDVSVVATVASLMRRSWEAGLAAGRAEVVDEQPTVQALRAQGTAQADALDVAQGDAQRYGRAIDEVVAAVSVFEAEPVQERRNVTVLLAAIEDAIGGIR